MAKRRIKWAVTILAVILILLALQRLLMPKYMSDILEGGMIEEYYDENMDHDVIFIGDCEVYENFSPAVLWEEYGINSYIRGSAEQLPWQSYYLMEESLKYETPDVIVWNVLAMEFNEPQKESYNRMTLDGMRWSMSKVNSIRASMTEEESFIEYVFPILRYHSRWSDLTADDFKYFWKKDEVTFNGYYMRVDVLPAEDVPTGRALSDYTFGENAYYYLDMMTELCAENDVELVLIKAPSLYPYWYDEWDEQIEEYAQEHGLKYYNFLDMTEEIGLDYSTDTYDAGLHLNLSGAEKLSSYFGEILTEECGLTSRRGEETLESEWTEKLAAYRAEIERQTEALEQ
ncbi:MAG: SGNH/GDSL hydrolase family protein [Clostridiales bacterium]|nr:SGNH/GDSL hydrolase family protein [Clostridiales bacterium]